ncbi:bifunctional farnesyl-diphosphate farnesyltransferase/squalene synthase [Cryptotrichosporon argae]
MGVLQYLILGADGQNELRALVSYAVWTDKRDLADPKHVEATGWDRETMRRCWGMLDETSRSFSMVIKELDGELTRVIAIFYLVLRALDTVEDDMTLPNATKLPLLRAFHTKLYEPGWHFDGSGPNEKDRQVLVEFDKVQAEFARLPEKCQVVIADITRKMGAGMADYAALATPEMPVAEVTSIENYDLYCHYVAGLVGEGLSGLFAGTGKERLFLATQLTLSNSMGLLLQKTNIYRDIKEDVDDGRGFWPRAIWGKYGFDSMKELVDPAREKDAQWAANEMVLDALRHATDALDYMTLLRNQTVFNFVAIPAVMAIATLERCFMNPAIFRRNVKIRKGEAVQLIHKAVNPRDVAYVFRDYARKIHAKVPKDEPNLLKFSIAVGKIEQWTEHHYPSFLHVFGGAGGAQTAIDTSTGDARAPLFMQLANDARDKAAAARREQWMDEMRAKGLIKPKGTAEEEKKKLEDLKQYQENEKLPYLLIIGTVFGVLALIAGLGGLVVWVIVKYADDGRR